MPASRFLQYTGRKWPNPVCSFYLPVSTSWDDPVHSPRPTTLSTHHNLTRHSSALLFKKLNSSLPLPNLHNSTLDYHIRYATHAFKVDLQTDPLPDMTSQPHKHRERAFRNMMRKTISTLWKGQLYNSTRSHLGQPPGRKTFLHSNCPRRFATLRSF